MYFATEAPDLQRLQQEAEHLLTPIHGPVAVQQQQKLIYLQAAILLQSRMLTAVQVLRT